ncbi:MAG: ATP-binding protein [Paracoccaceae bacterium]
MSDATLIEIDPTAVARRLAPRIWAFVWLGLALLVAGTLSPDRVVSLGFTVGSTTIFALALIITGLNRKYLATSRHFHDSLDAFVHGDATPTLCMADGGEITYANRAARHRFGDVKDTSLILLLTGYLANPVNVIFRLQHKARSGQVAQEDLVTEKGHMRLSVQHIGPMGFIWRMEDLVEKTSEEPHAPGPIALPMLYCGEDGTVLHMNHALFRKVGQRINHLDRLFSEFPLRSGALCEIATRDGPETVRLLVIPMRAGREEIYFLPCEGDETEGDETGDNALPRNPFFDEMPVALMKLSASGSILEANRMARWLLGDPTRDSKPFSDLVQGLGRPIGDWLSAAADGRALNRGEIVQAKRTEKDTYLQVTLSRIADRGEFFLLAVLHDVTEIKTLEAQIVQSQKMQAIGQLAGGVAHDFNNLLTAISGYCDLLLMRHDSGDPDYGDLVQINQNANRAAGLVNQLLAFSRKQNLQPALIDLRDVLSEVSHLLNRLLGAKVTLGVENADDLALIRADRRQLEQVLMNLVVNARDAMSGEGDIRIETENLILKEELRRDRAVVEAGSYVSVRVRDNGSGIPPDRVRKIFEPFFTTKRTGEGTGLGLSMVYGIIKQTGGFIFVDSVQGQGTEFQILLPAFDAPQTSHETRPKAEAGATTARKDGVVLLVEDEAPVRGFAARALKMQGYTVLEAENGDAALALLQGGAREVDVFVTDVIMPGMDGPTWVARALGDYPGVRVVFVSGYAEESFAEQQAAIPNSVFLPKPFSLGELTACVRAQMDAEAPLQRIEA